MTLSIVESFFGYTSLINGCLVLFITFAYLINKDFIYNVHNKFFPMPREHHRLAMYMFIGLFKTFFIVFNLVPYLALLILH